MMKTDKNDLGYLGEDFQYRLVHVFVEDKEFFKDLSSVIDQNMFTNPRLKMYVGVLKESYDTMGSVPSYRGMETLLLDKAKTEADRQYIFEVSKKIETINVEDVELVKNAAMKFFKQQNIIKTANEILRIAGDGDHKQYDRCVELLQDALSKGVHEDLGNTVFDNLAETLSNDYRTPIPTGVGKLDEALEGGLGKGELGVIIGSSSFGKAQPLDARIVTPNGFKRMGDMKIGDEVIGRDGKPYKVSGVFPQGVRPIYKVTLSNGTSCECDIEHLWNVNSIYQRSSRKYIKGKSKNRDDKYILHDYSFKTLTLREILDKGIIKHGKHNFRVPVNDAVEFEYKPLDVDPYILGYYIGDGCYNKSAITVGVLDIEDAKANIVHLLNEDATAVYYPKRNIWAINIKGETKRNIKKIYDNVDSLLSAGKYIPNEYLFNTVENRLSLLQGLMDSDGYANKNGSCEFATKSEKLAYQIQFLIRSLGGYASLATKNTFYTHPITKKRIDCGLSYRLTISLVNPNLPIFRLKRKQERVKYRTRHAHELYIDAVEYVGEKEAQCIMVDSAEHLYLTEDFIVTHNTSLTTAMASHAATYKCEQNNNKGFKVLQIVFEDRIKQIQRKHLGRITGVEARDLSKDEYKHIVEERLQEYQDKEMLLKNLRIVRFPSGEYTAQHIYRYIKKLIANGFKPDLTIIDYFECLAHVGDGSTSNEYEKEGKTMRKLEAIAGELDMAIWVPTQGTKDSVNLELVTMDKAGGSFKKIQIAHIVMSIARTMEDIEANKATIALLKNRAGKSGKVFNNVEFNNGTCQISTDNCDSFENMTAYNANSDKMKQEVIKKIMSDMKK